jgi:hypothetical protein
MSGDFIRSALGEVLAFIGLTDSTGQPLALRTARLSLSVHHQCHPLRPPASNRAGHRRPHQHQHQMGYNAIYPEETINAHRAFIARRRSRSSTPLP